MTAEERVAKLEQTVRDFNLTLLGTDQIHGGFPELEPKTVLEERLQQLEAAHDKFEIRGGHNANVEGSLRTGYAVNMKCGAQAATGTGNVNIPPTPPPSPSCGSPPVACCSENVQFCIAWKTGFFQEFAGFESTPPKFYKTFVSHSHCDNPGFGTPTDLTETAVRVYDEPFNCFPNENTSDWHEDDSCVPEDCLGPLFCDPCSLGTPTANSATHATTDTSACPQSWVTWDISDELTDVELKAVVYDSLQDFGEFRGCINPGTNGNQAGAGFDVDHTLFSVVRFDYKFTFDAQPFVFSVRWRIKYTPYVGGEPGTPYYSDFFCESIAPGAVESSVYNLSEVDEDNTFAEIYDISTDCDAC